MKYKDFNKFGDTCYRVKNQLDGYMNVLSFLYIYVLENGNLLKNEFEAKEWEDKFIDWCEIENIYLYKKRNINRLNFVLSFLVRINILEKNKTKYVVDKHGIENILNNKYFKNIFFNKFYENLIPFKQAIDFIQETNFRYIDIDWLSVAILLYEESDDFKEVYKNIVDDFNEVLNIITKKSLKENCDINNPKSLIKTWRKRGKDIEHAIELLTLIKDKKLSEEAIVKNYKNKLLENIIKTNEFEFQKNNKKVKNKDEKIRNYLTNITYEELFFTLEKMRLWSLLVKEYTDLNVRWFKNFGIVSDNKFIDKDKINFINGKYEIIIKDIKKYPFHLYQVEEYLRQINDLDFSFKSKIKMQDKSNSVLAEYFVNLYYALKMKIDVKEFLELCRTCIDNQSLFPYSTAPGKGPDMFHIINDKLRIIETTIHKTRKLVENNEIFNVCDHINIQKIRYLKNKEIDTIKNTEVFLISPVTKDFEKQEINEKITRNNQNTIPNNNEIYDFNSFINFDKKSI